MDELKELSELYSPTGGPVLDILMILKKTHTELLEIFDDAEREVKTLWKKN